MSLKLSPAAKKAVTIGSTCSISYLAVCFLLFYWAQFPGMNTIFLIAAITASNGAATMLWSRYCPGLRDTGMVSTATGFLDATSYLSAAVSTKVFANAVSSIGWSNLILVWIGLMITGIIVSMPYRKKPA